MPCKSPAERYVNYRVLDVHREILYKVLKRRFGVASEALFEKVESIYDKDILIDLFDAALDPSNLDALEKLIPAKS